MCTYKRYIITSVLLLAVLFAPVRSARAFWNDYDVELFAQYLDVAWDEYKGILMGSLKSAAYEAIASKVSSLINGGDSGQARFITNWEDFLYGAAERETKIVINDFFTSTFGGASSSSYVSSSAQTSTSATASIPLTSTNYAAYLEQNAREAVFHQNKDLYKYTMNEYCGGDPSKMFSEGNWQCVNAYFSNIAYNSTYGFNQTTQSVAYSEYEKQVKKNVSQSIAYDGFKAVQDKLSSNLVATPGSIVASVQKSLYNAILNVPGNASNPWELIQLSAATFVNGFITDLFNQASAQVENTVNTAVKKGIDTIADKIGDAEVSASTTFNSVSESETNQSKWNFVGTGSGSGL